MILGTQLPDTLIFRGLFHGLQSSRDRRKARTGRRENPRQIRIFGRQRDRSVESLLLIIVAIHSSTISMSLYFLISS